MNISKKIYLISSSPNHTGGIAGWTKSFLSWNISNNNDVQLISINKHSLKIISMFYVILKVLFIRKKNNTIFHINSSVEKFGLIRDFFVCYLLVRKNINYIMHFHCDISTRKKTNDILNLTNYIVKNAKQNIVLNAQSYDFLVNFASNVVLIPNFVDDLFFSNFKLRTIKSISSVIFIGHVKKEKGFYEILELSRINPEIIFNIIGPVKLEIDKNSLPSNFILHGNKNKLELIDELDKADLFLFPSHSEGFSLAIIEALARGLPVLVSNVGAANEIVTSESGYIFKSKCLSDLREKFDYAKEDFKKGINTDFNHNYIKDNFSIEIVIKKILNIYESNF